LALIGVPPGSMTFDRARKYPLVGVPPLGATPMSRSSVAVEVLHRSRSASPSR
jgi:hypothetical protein